MKDNLRQIIITSILLRVSQLFVDYNYDHPDEYWQGSQIAYKLRYGYGFQSWQWTMQEPIRSPLYQLYLSLGYVLCDTVGCDSYLKQIAPKIMQTGLSIVCDIFLIKTANHYVKNIPYWIHLLLLTQWYYFSGLNRTYINSAETCLALISFYLWVTRQQNRLNDLISRILVVIGFSMRPTSLILWAIVWPYQLLTKKNGKTAFILKNALQLIVTALFSIAVGTLWYGKFTWTDFNFFKYNVFLKYSEMYGVHPFYFYFVPFLPLIMGGYLIPLILSIKQNRFYFAEKKEKLKQQGEEEQDKVQVVQIYQARKFWELFFILQAVLLVLSFSVHKEPRFLLVLTPFLLILSIKGLKKLQNNKLVLALIIFINIVLFSGFNITMKTGGTEVLRDLRQQIDKYPPSQHKNINLIYLCEPHNLPLMTIIQRPINFNIIDSSPFRKLQHFLEQVQLMNNPFELFNQLAKGKDPQFIIIQQKFAMKGVHLNQKYQFLLEKGYEIISSRRNILIFDFVFGQKWDGFALLKKK